jgi:hypothetical protein
MNADQVPPDPNHTREQPEQGCDGEAEKNQAPHVRGYRLFLFLTPM